jgi:hypothetical protein
MRPKNSSLLVQNPLGDGAMWQEDWFRMRYWERTSNEFKLVGIYTVNPLDDTITKVVEENADLAMFDWLKNTSDCQMVGSQMFCKI